MRTRLPQRRRFRVFDFQLEDRTVPSGSPLAQIGASYVAQFQVGFADLANTFVKDAQTILLANGDSGIAANVASFDSALQGAIGALQQDLDAKLGLLPLAKDGLRTEIDESLAGTSGSLLEVLQSVTPPTDTAGATAQAFGSAASSDIAQTLTSDISELDAFFSPTNPERLAISGAGSGTSTLKLINEDYDKQIKTAFENLALAYANTANSTLFTAADVAGIAAARSDFDETVVGGVTDIIANLTSKFSVDPLAGEGLTTSVQQRLAGTNGLLEQLEGLATPTDLDGVTAEAFGQGAATAISSAYHDVITLVNDFFEAPRTVSTAGSGSTTSSGTGSSGSKSSSGSATGSNASGSSTSTGGTSSSTTTGTTSTGSTGESSGTSSVSAGELTTTQSAATNGFLNGFNSSLGSGYGESLNGTFYEGTNGTLVSPITTSEQTTTISGTTGTTTLGGAFNGFNSTSSASSTTSTSPTSVSGNTATTTGATSSGTGVSTGTTGDQSIGTGFDSGFSNGFDNGFGSDASSAFGPGYNSGFGDGSSSNFSPNYPTGSGTGTNDGSTTGFTTT